MRQLPRALRAARFVCALSGDFPGCLALCEVHQPLSGFHEAKIQLRRLVEWPA